MAMETYQAQFQLVEYLLHKTHRGDIMKKISEFDVATLIGIAKQVSLKAVSPPEITNIIYKFDEDKKLSVEDHNTILKFVYDSSIKWQKPKSMGDMLADIMMKVSNTERRKPDSRYGGTSPATKAEIEAIHHWVMTRKN